MVPTDLITAPSGSAAYYRQVELASRLDASGECWVWMGSVTRDGYGKLAYRHGHAPTHREAWSAVNGPIPPGVFVCHRCDNPPCCNPAHLFLGTARENTRDSLIKGRHGSLKQAGRVRGPYRKRVL